MVFGRKKKDQGSDTPADVATQDVDAPSRAGKKKRRPTELLSSVVNESAVGAAIDIMKRNDAFALPNGTSWVGLMLAAADIGGLSQKQKNDATKGSIIELIRADKIQVVVTKPMLDAEVLGIIPTSETLARMEEYQLLTNAPYYWVVFRSEDGGTTLVADHVEGVPATYAQAAAISRGELMISEVLPQVWAWAGGVTEPAAAEPAFDELLVGAPVGRSEVAIDNATDPLAETYSFADSGIDFAELDSDIQVDPSTGVVLDDEPSLAAEDDSPEMEFDDFLSETDEDQAPFDNTWLDADDAPDEEAEGESDGYLQYLVENRDRVVDEQEVRETIARRFLSSDLDLTVDLEEFDRIFATDADAIALEVSEDTSDWLGKQVAQLSRQANAELAQLHRDNVDELRQLYVETMALHVEKTMAAVSTDVPGSQYAELMEGAKRDFEDRRANSPQELAEIRRELIERFEKAAQRRADQAAAHARAVYEDRHRPKLEKDLAEAGLDLDRRLEEQYAHNRQIVLDMRRKDANVRMDVGTNRIFEHLREVQAQQREGERELLRSWNERLVQFIDENRKNDIARAQALAEELARSNHIETLKREHAEQLRIAREEHAEREKQLQNELIRNREEALADLQRRQTEWSASLDVEKERSRAGNDLISQLKAQVETLGTKYEERYRNEIENLKADKEAGALELERAHAMHKRVNFIIVLLAAVLTVAGVAAGVIAGWSWGYAHSVDSAPVVTAVEGSTLI